MYTRIAHAVAGTLILTSLLLTVLTENNNWLWITTFVGVNLLQNAMTNWCLLHQILKKIGVKDEGSSCSV
ncbi:MAG: DUF2892 domain-containing protein [Weeksellaceae bacterium]|jgi:hypothetical protein